MRIEQDAAERERLARDRSSFRVLPAAVAFPRDAPEVAEALGWARERGLAVTARAGGSSVAGQCLGEGLVLDTSGLDGIEPDGEAVWCGAGVGLDELNAALEPHGRMLGPDTTSSEWARVGGIVATNACGSRSLRYGRVGEVVQALEGVDAAGAPLALEAGELPQALVAGLGTVLEGLEQDLAAGWPAIHRGFGGYRLDAFARERDALSLVPGSEGTLCLLTRARLATVPLPQRRDLSRAEFPTLRAALDVAPACVATGASAVEVLDTHLTGGDPVLLVEHLDEPDGPGRLPAVFELLAPGDAERAWRMRHDALVHLAAAGREPVALFEDPAVAAEQAGPFCDELLALLGSRGLDAVVYGHAGAGCLHVRPLVDPRAPGLARTLMDAQRAVADLVA
ncbi:MAG: FAD-binding oxidoreductase, partial [Thermoleophilaceae bacterium]|nr:FAD-binding oxidoreductase [Thermoleophilaceae bacterium]